MSQKFIERSRIFCRWQDYHNHKLSLIFSFLQRIKKGFKFCWNSQQFSHLQEVIQGLILFTIFRFYFTEKNATEELLLDKE